MGGSRDRSMSADSRRSRSKDSRRGRSRGRSGSAASNKDDDREEKLTRTTPIDKDDAAFVLGRGGATKRKIARVSGAEIELDEQSLSITLTGTVTQCDAARDYIDYVTQQRTGPVSIKTETGRNDFSALEVPRDCIGFVMGRNGQTLRTMEEEWGVLMFFAKISRGREADHESLCIFGPLPARRGAEIKTLSAIEHKSPGFCISSKGELRDLDRVEGDEDRDGWATETLPLSEDNYSYALGAKGSTRRKLAAASGCIIEYVGKLACFCGYKKDRRRGKDYLRWLIEQRTGNSNVENPRAREDCTVVKVPMDSVAFLTGHRGEALREIERESSTFCFTQGGQTNRDANKKDVENLLVFSYSRAARDHAAEIVQDRIAKHKRMGGSAGRGRDDRGRDKDRDRSRSRDRRDRRDRSKSRDRKADRRRRDDSEDSRDRRRRRDRSRSRSRSRGRRR